MKLTQTRILQAKVCSTLGIDARFAKKFRERWLEPHEHWEENRLIYWTQEAADRIAGMLDGKPPTPAMYLPAETQAAAQPVLVPMEAPVEEVIEETPAVEEEPPPAPVVIAPPAAPADDILTVRVLKRARNYQYVYANLDGERIPVLCPKKGRKNIIGKNVRIKRAEVAGATKYTLIP